MREREKENSDLNSKNESVQALCLNTKTETWKNIPNQLQPKSVTARVVVCYSTCETPPT